LDGLASGVEGSKAKIPTSEFWALRKTTKGDKPIRDDGLYATLTDTWDLNPCDEWPKPLEENQTQ
jgi:hypothetical protein